MEILKIKNGCVSILINWQTKKQKKERSHDRILWLNYSNTKEQKRVFGNKSKYHFSFDIPKVITISSAHAGKKLIGRLNLIKLFGRNYQICSTSDLINN